MQYFDIAKLTAVDAADAADLVTSASSHFREEEDGGLDASSPVATIATDAWFAANHVTLFTPDNPDASDTNAPVIHGDGSHDAVAVATTGASWSAATAVTTDNSAFGVASAARQAFGGNDDGQSAPGAATFDSSSWATSRSDVSAADLANARCTTSDSPEIFADPAISAAPNPGHRSSVTAAATSATSHATDTPVGE